MVGEISSSVGSCWSDTGPGIPTWSGQERSLQTNYSLGVVMSKSSSLLIRCGSAYSQLSVLISSGIDSINPCIRPSWKRRVVVWVWWLFSAHANCTWCFGSIWIEKNCQYFGLIVLIQYFFVFFQKPHGPWTNRGHTVERTYWHVESTYRHVERTYRHVDMVTYEIRIQLSYLARSADQTCQQSLQEFGENRSKTSYGRWKVNPNFVL